MNDEQGSPPQATASYLALKKTESKLSDLLRQQINDAYRSGMERAYESMHLHNKRIGKSDRLALWWLRRRGFHYRAYIRDEATNSLHVR